MKLLHNGNKMLAEIGHSTVICILHNIVSPRYIQLLQQEMNGTKSPLVHVKMAQYLYIILTVYPIDVIAKVGPEVVQTYLSQCINNPSAETRTIGRKAFLLWQNIDEGSADQLFNTLD